jgi:hypothetical protein
VFRVLGEEIDWEEVGFGVDCETEADPATIGEPILIGVWLREENVDSKSAELVRTLLRVVLARGGWQGRGEGNSRRARP